MWWPASDGFAPRELWRMPPDALPLMPLDRLRVAMNLSKCVVGARERTARLQQRIEFEDDNQPVADGGDARDVRCIRQGERGAGQTDAGRRNRQGLTARVHT